MEEDTALRNQFKVGSLRPGARQRVPRTMERSGPVIVRLSMTPSEKTLRTTRFRICPTEARRDYRGAVPQFNRRRSLKETSPEAGKSTWLTQRWNIRRVLPQRVCGVARTHREVPPLWVTGGRGPTWPGVACCRHRSIDQQLAIDAEQCRTPVANRGRSLIQTLE